MKQNKIPKNEYIIQPKGKTNPYKHDVIYSDLGQWKYPGQVTKIPSNQITMQGVNYPVQGVDNTGYSQMMYPGMDYQFPGNYVTEYPQMQIGGLIKKGLTAAKKVAKNTYKVNPWAFKPNPNASYRLLGEKGLQDLKEIGVVRPNPEGLFIKTDPYPYFSRGEILDKYYDGNNMIEILNHPMTKNRRAAWSPHKDIVIPRREIKSDNPNLKVYEKNWLKGWKEMSKQSYGGDPSLNDIEGHYPFGGQNTKTHTHMAQGGWLDTMQVGGYRDNTSVRKPNTLNPTELANAQPYRKLSKEDQMAMYVDSAIANRQPDELRKTKKQGFGSKAHEVFMNPFTALTNLHQHGRLPDNFSQGETNALDFAVGVINPLYYLEAAYNTGKAAFDPETYKDLGKTVGLGVNALAGDQSPDEWKQAGFNTLFKGLDASMVKGAGKMVSKNAKRIINKNINKTSKNIKKGLEEQAGKYYQNIQPNKYGGDLQEAQWGKIIKAGLKGTKELSKPITKVIHPTPINTKLKEELTPYLLRSYKPFTKEEKILNSFLSPEAQYQKLLDRTTHFNKDGTILKKGGQKGLKKYTSKNIQSSVNDIMLRNETLFGPAGKKRYKPGLKYKSGGGWLDKYQDTGEVVPKDDPYQNKEFLIDMANSPLFNERYSKMTGSDNLSEAEAYKNNIINNINNVKYETNPKILNRHNAEGMYMPKNHTIYKNETEDDSTDLHELSHASTKGKLNFKDPYNYDPSHFDNVYGSTYKEKLGDDGYNVIKKKVEGIYSKKKMGKYISEPTEIKSRVDVGRRALEDNRLYDPINERFEEKHYNELKKFNRDSNIMDLLHNYSKEDVIRMFNEIVTNKPKQQPVAKMGGNWLDNLH